MDEQVPQASGSLAKRRLRTIWRRSISLAL